MTLTARADRRRHQPGDPAAQRGLGRGRVRARGRGRRSAPPPGPRRGRCRWPPGSARCPGSAPAAPSTGREVLVGRPALLAEHGLAVRPTWPASARSGSTRAVPRCWPAGTGRPGAPWPSRTRSSRRPPPRSPGCAASGCTRSCSPGTAPRPRGSVAAAVGIDEVVAGTLPAGKAAFVSGLRAAGHRVAMVGRRRQRRPGAGRGRPRAGPRLRHRRGDLRRRHDPAERRPGGRAGRAAAGPGHVHHDPPQPGLGLRVQPGGGPAGRAGPAQPGHRVGRDDFVLGLRRS